MFITTVALFSPAGWSPAIIAAMLVAIVLMGFPANVAWAGADNRLERWFPTSAACR